MKKAKMILNKVLYPSKWILISVPPIVFAALIFIFAANKKESAAAYPIYGLSAYSLIIWLVSAPKLLRSVKTGIMNNRAVKKIAGTKIGGRYLSDMAFRGSIGIYQGMAVNFLYLLFRVIAGIRYASVWFISIAVYYLVLGTLRAYLIFSYRRRKKYGLSYEYRCYRRTAWLLFLLNIPMGGMIVLMIRANAGYTYPGYVIYLSALYTFYTMILSVVNLVRFRKNRKPDSVRRQSAEFCCFHDVDPRIADGDDRSIFGRRYEFPEADEYRNRKRCVRNRYYYRCIYADSFCTKAKGGGAL